MEVALSDGENTSLLHFGHLALAGATSILPGPTWRKFQLPEAGGAHPMNNHTNPWLTLLQTELFDAFQAEGGRQLFLSSGSFVPQSHPWQSQEVEIQFSG